MVVGCKERPIPSVVSMKLECMEWKSLKKTKFVTFANVDSEDMVMNFLTSVEFFVPNDFASRLFFNSNNTKYYCVYPNNIQYVYCVMIIQIYLCFVVIDLL